MAILQYRILLVPREGEVVTLLEHRGPIMKVDDVLIVFEGFREIGMSAVGI